MEQRIKEALERMFSAHNEPEWNVKRRIIASPNVECYNNVTGLTLRHTAAGRVIVESAIIYRYRGGWQQEPDFDETIKKFAGALG